MSVISAGKKLLAIVGILGTVLPPVTWAYGAEKIWRPSYSFQDQSSWSSGKLPSMGNKIVLEESQAVFWPQNVIINTEVIFGENSALVFSLTAGDKGPVPIAQPRKDGSKEVEEVVKFPAGTSRNAWFDPHNWNYGPGFNSDPALNMSPVPEADRIPCPGDFVVFPGNTTYQVDVEADVGIHSLKVGIQTEAFRSSERFSTFRKTSVGTLQFRGAGKINLQQCPAATATSCPCTNSQPETLSKICSYVTPEMCQPQTKFCEDPVKPVGSCCPICGAVTHATMKSSTMPWQEMWKKVEQIRDEALSRHGHLLAHAGVTHEGLLQIVAVDSTGDLEAAKKALGEIGSALVAAALTDTPVIMAAQISAFGGPRHPIMIAFLVLLFLSGVVFGALVCAKRHNWRHLPPGMVEYIPEVDFEAIQGFFRERGLGNFGSGLGRGGDAASVSWARLREAHAAGGGAEEEFGAVGSRGVVCLSNPIFDEAGFREVPSARQKGTMDTNDGGGTPHPSEASSADDATSISSVAEPAVAMPPSPTNPFATSNVDQLIQIDSFQQS